MDERQSGDFVLDGEGNKIIEELAPVLDDEGNPVNDTIVTEHENYMGTKNGLPGDSLGCRFANPLISMQTAWWIIWSFIREERSGMSRV